MNDTFRTAVTLVVVVIAAACRRGGADISRGLSERLAIAPPQGPTCYRGTAQLFRDTAESGSMAHERRWMVLDPAPASESGYRIAHLMTPEGRNAPMYARWRRVGDSIEVQESNTFPPATWVFADSGAVLVGRGNMIHDVVVRDVSGRLVPTQSDWRARAIRTPCEDLR